MPSAVLGTRTRRYCSCDVYCTRTVLWKVLVLVQYAEDVVVQYAYEYSKDSYFPRPSKPATRTRTRTDTHLPPVRARGPVNTSGSRGTVQYCTDLEPYITE